MMMQLFFILLFYGIFIYGADKNYTHRHRSQSTTSIQNFLPFDTSSVSPQAATLLVGRYENKFIKSKEPIKLKKFLIQHVINNSPYSLYLADLNQETHQLDNILQPYEKIAWNHSVHDSSHVRFQFFRLTPTKDQPTLGILQGEGVHCYMFCQADDVRIKIVQNNVLKNQLSVSHEPINIQFTKQPKVEQVVCEFRSSTTT